MAVEIPLTKGQVALIDEADFALVGGVKWHLGRSGYANRKASGSHVSMHRMIVGAVAGQVVDHINGNKLDNRRCNLRITDARGNARNQSKQQGARSLYRGVSFYDGVFVVRIFVDGNNLYFGRFTDEYTAARVYDYAAAMHYGEFARLNLPNEPRLSDEEFQTLTERRPVWSTYRGVSWRGDRRKWRAYIQVQYRMVSLGHFSSEVEAARAYNVAALQYHGDKAILNEV